MTKAMTDDQWAALEPWTNEALEESKPVSNEKWNEIGRAHLPTVRIAWILLGKTKEELKEIVAKLEDTDVVDQITMGSLFLRDTPR